MAKKKPAKRTEAKARKPARKRAPKTAAPTPAPVEPPKRSGRDRQAVWEREQTAKAAEIGPVPAVVNPARRKACEFDLYRFLVTYFPASTGLHPFSDDHKKLIANVQNVVLHGGRQANVIYRGAGKSTISENSALWAVLYGHRRFPLVLALNKRLSGKAIDSIKYELSDNELLLEDFPEVCFPVCALENKPQRCKSQTQNGQPTHMVWTSDTIMLPSIAGSVAASNVVAAVPIERALGTRVKRPDGTQQRPDLVIIDDPQDHELARNPDQVQKMLGVIRRDILRLGGHNTTLAVVANMTVRERGDVPDSLLNDPAWQGCVMPMVRRFADAHETDWMDAYASIRRSFDRKVPGDRDRAIKAGNAYYLKKRKPMDAGANVSWEHCYSPDSEISAIQHAYNILIDDGEEAFASECQCAPLDNLAAAGEQLEAVAIAKRINQVKRGAAPLNTHHLTAFIDVQGSLLYWLVAAWSDTFGGAVVDYGSWPEQGRNYYTLTDAKRTLAKKYPQAGQEGAWRSGLDDLALYLLGREWRREDSLALQVERCLVDANYGRSTETVYQFCRESPFAARLTPSHGKYVGPQHKPFHMQTPKQGERRGLNWLQPVARRRAIRHVVYDTNAWKSFVAARLDTTVGDAGSLVLFGDSPAAHRMFADHCTSEVRQTLTKKDRTIEVWTERPHHPDNHLWDALVGCAVAASMQGCRLPGAGGPEQNQRRQRRKITAHDLRGRRAA